MASIIKSFATNLVYLAFLFIFAIATCSKQEREPSVARLGKTTISLAEFRDRYEFTPHVHLTRNKELNKRRVLASLLGEKLLAEAAYPQKLNKDERFLAFAEQMEKEATVELLFEQEVGDKIQITEDELKHAFLLSQTELSLQVLSFNNMEQAIAAKQQLDAGKSFNQVKREFQTDTFISADSVLSLTMKWGEAHPNLETAAYNLNLNDVSDPVEADGMFFIMKLIQRRSDAFTTEADFMQESASIRQKIKQRKRDVMFTDFLRSLMGQKQAKVSLQLFDFVAGELESFYRVHESSSTAPPVKQTSDTPLDLLQTGNLAEHLNEAFVRFDDGSSWSIEEFIKKLSIGPYRLNIKSHKAFRASLNLAIKRMVEFESLAQRGRDLELHKRHYVRSQTKMWCDAYLAQQLRQQLLDTVTVSNSEIRSYYDRHKDNYRDADLVNLQEILVADENLAHDLLRRIKNGEDMGRLARIYSKRSLSKDRDGIMGYFVTSALGKIGEVAKNLHVGEIGGPVKTEESQFSIFKLLDKREAEILPLEKVWQTVQQDARSEKKAQVLDNFLMELADTYPIEINQSALDTLRTTNLPMIVLKQHFPNRTIAPIVTSLHNAESWQRLIEEKYPWK